MVRDLPDFVEVSTVAVSAVIEMRYAGTRHPFGEAMYPLNRAFLRRNSALRLAQAQAYLKPHGFRLKVWDAYRPLSVQAAMWAAVPNDHFVAPPSRGSRHNRGAAVDVTLVDDSGADVEMPTDFDDFTPAARPDSACSKQATLHRDILRAAMLSAGFTGIGSEWWHFDDPDWRDYPVCDTSLEELAEMWDNS